MKILTANSLTTGEVVFWNAGRWSVRFSDGERFDGDDAANAALAQAEAQPTVAVAAYLIDVEDNDGHWVPTAFRERLRALGPSNTPQHGKQADGDADVEAFQASHSAARSTGRVKLIKR
jgi:sulfite reductase (NADPH) hemoprotein beta-component